MLSSAALALGQAAEAVAHACDALDVLPDGNAYTAALAREALAAAQDRG